MIKNINLEIAFDEVKGKSTNELRQTQTDIFASVYSLQKQCAKWLANAKPQIIDIMKNAQNTDVNSFVSGSDELLLNVINKTPRLSTKLVREVVDVQTYLKFIPSEKKEKNSHLCGSYQKIDNFLILDKQITLIPKSYQFNKGGKNE
jgi:ABC-type transporter Mla subunit MlaD